jgi:hypothetical protein
MLYIEGSWESEERSIWTQRNQYQVGSWSEKCETGVAKENVEWKLGVREEEVGVGGDEGWATKEDVGGW